MPDSVSSAACATLSEVTRGGVVESRHVGAVAVVDRHGRVLQAAGDPYTLTFTRSALKPLQALPFVAGGGIERFGYSPAQTALMCASHSGEPRHVEAVAAMLSAAGRTPADLQCGTHAPGFYDARGELPPPPPYSPLQHNCSGKHAGMLAACVAAGWDTATYRDPDHPYQRLVVEVVQELTGDTVGPVTVDGCGAPALAVSALGLARAFGTIASADPATPEGRVADAIRAHPEWLGGTSRDVTDLVRGVPGLIAKDGAEAVYAAGLADGGGVVVKITDGGDRARVGVATAALRRLGVLDLGPGVAAVLDELDARAVVRGHGEPVGAVRALPLPGAPEPDAP